MVIYCVSGLGADYRAFSQLKVNADLVHINWKTPEPEETIEAYATRLTSEIDTSTPFGLMGLSFGGLIAVEMAKILAPQFVILISSVDTRQDMPHLYKAISHVNFIKYLPANWFKPPKRLVKFLFGTQSTDLLYPILEDTDPWFVKWALQVLVSWKNKEKPAKITKINGTADRLFKPSNSNQTIKVKNGHHFMIVDLSEKISNHINQVINTQLS